MRTLLTGTLLLALLGATALAPAFAQSTGNASVAVVEVESGAIMGANGIDAMIPANLAGRIGFAILAHEWMDVTQTDPATPLAGGAPDLTIGTALNQLLVDGRDGEMARALLAARIGYTPSTLDGAMAALLQEVGVEARGVNVQRSANGGPEWTGTVTTRDTARMGVALARLHGEALGGMVQAGAGLQCIAIGPGATTTTTWVGVVSGAISAEGCIMAASNSIGLTDTRVAEGVRIVPGQPADAVAPKDPIAGVALP
jgi:hypothetical protein